MPTVLAPPKATSCLLLALSITTFAGGADAAGFPPVVTTGGSPWVAIRDGRTISSLADPERRHASLGQPVGLARLDLDGDGYDDLAVGYSAEHPSIAIHRANREAFAPTDPSVLRDLARGETAPPFLPVPMVVPIPDSPDLLQAGDFDRDGQVDLIAARRGSSRFWFLRGLSDGKLGTPEAIDVDGGIRLLSSGELGLGDALLDLFVGVETSDGGEIELFDGSWNAFAVLPTIFRVSSPPIALALGDLDGAPGRELAVALREGVRIFEAGGDSRLVPTSAAPRAIAISDLVWDRDARAELAILDEEGTLRILERGELDVRPWKPGELRRVGGGALDADKTVEPAATAARGAALRERWQLPAASPRAGNGAAALFPLLTNSGYQLDRDLAVVDPAIGEIHLLMPPRPASHEPSRSDERRDVSLRLPGSPLAVLPMRLNVLPEEGFVVVVAGSDEPLLYPEAILSTITVNTTLDSNNGCATSGTGTCSLRDAIRFSNANAGTDVILFGIGGSFTLTQANSGGVNEDASLTGDLDVRDSVTITGSGTSSTIVQAGTSSLNGIDKVFAFNPICDHAVSATVTGVAIRFGRNTQAWGAADFSFTGGGLDWCGFGAGAFNFNNDLVDQNTNVNGYGGGVNLDTATGANGTITMTGTTISNNTARATGGGINVFGDDDSLVLNGGSTVSANTTLGTGGFGAQGGGLYVRITNNAPSTGTVQISNATISNNVANMVGGGICISAAGKQNVTIQSTTISGNTAQAGQGNAAWGGGLFNETQAGYTTTLTGVTVSSNHADLHAAGTAPLGGGIHHNAGTLNMTGGSITNNSVGAGQTLGNGGGISVYAGTATLSGLAAFSGNSARVSGGAVAVANSGAGTFTNLTIQSNSAGTSGGALFVGAGSLSASLCRIVSNTAPTGSGIAQAGGTATVQNDWWGCDGFPGATGCQTGAGTYSADPRIDLRLSALPTSIQLGGTSGLTADVTKNSNGVNTNGGAAPAVLVGLPLTFVDDPKGSIATPLAVTIPSGGTIAKAFTAGGTGSSCGAATPGVTLDSGTQRASVQIQCPDLTAGESASATVLCGGTVTYTLTASNAGDLAAANVTLSDDVADCLTGVGCVASQGSCGVGAGNLVTASLGTIAAGGSATVTVTGTVPPSCGSSVANAATTVATTSIESNGSNNGSPSTSTTVQCADLLLAKSGPANVCAGSVVTYTLTPSNGGSASASSVTVTDDLADCLAGVTCTPSVGTCNVAAGNVATASLGSLAAGASATITISGTVAVACQPNLSNSATVSTGSLEWSTTNNGSSTVATAIDIAPSISSPPASSTICAGAATTFSVTAGGTAPAYQWQLDSGSGFSNLSNGGVYSNVTGSTMTITGATTGMNGYSYRCVVSGSCSPAATSAAATLSVQSPLPSVGNSAKTSDGGTNLTLTWANVSGASDYAVYEDSSPSGPFGTTTGTASSGTTGLTIPPPSSDRYYRVAARNSCGAGSLK